MARRTHTFGTVAWGRFVRKVEQKLPGEYESLLPAQEPPLSVYCGGNRPRRLYFFTKDLLCRRWLQDEMFPKDWIALCRHSIPSAQYLEEIAAHVARLRLPLLFVGDLDPLDLTIFMMIRDALRSSRTPDRWGAHYGGVDDRWLALGDRYRRQGKRLDAALLHMESLEREHFQWVEELIPELDELVGPRSLEILQSGRKLELEGAVALDLHGRDFPRHVLRQLNGLALRELRQGPRRR